MKIVIKNLTLTNFKGERSLQVQFNDSINNVYGANGAGKTRLFDAFLWLLFGKDHLDRKDYEVKSYNRENVQDECSVEAVLLLDGRESRIKRALVEDWVKPRGQVERVYKGNHTDCWWDGTPVKVSDFQEKINTLINEDLFKMVTNPHYFVSQNWKVQRETLVKIAGVSTDTELAQSRAEFASLLNELTHKSLDEYKATLHAQKKLLKDRLNEINPRIDQVDKMRMTPSEMADPKANLAKIKAAIAEVDQALNDKAKEAKMIDDRLAVKRREKEKLISQQENVRRQAIERERTRVAEVNKEYYSLQDELTKKERVLSEIEEKNREARRKINSKEQEIRDLEVQMDALKTAWSEENTMVYEGETTCPYCGQNLPEERVAEMKETFNQKKNANLDAINIKGMTAKGNVERLKKEIEDLTLKIIRVDQEHFDEIKQLKEKLQGMTLKNEAAIDATTLPEYLALEMSIAKADSEYQAILAEGKIDKSELTEKRNKLQEDEHACYVAIQALEQNARCDKEIDELKVKEKDLAQQIADIEQKEAVVMQFTKAKVEECEENVNHLFDMVQFKMYDWTIEGNLIETCEATIDGVPYGSANNAKQINAGLDIIRTLSQIYQICAPIFIDNRESVTEIIPMDAQLINLIVSPTAPTLIINK